MIGVSGTVSSGEIAVQEWSVTGGGSRAGAKQEPARSRKSLKIYNQEIWFKGLFFKKKFRL